MVDSLTDEIGQMSLSTTASPTSFPLSNKTKITDAFRLCSEGVFPDLLRSDKNKLAELSRFVDTGNNGATALHLAAAFNRADVAQGLIRYGAGVALQTATGATPADVADSCGHSELAAQLRRAVIAAPSDFDWNPRAEPLAVFPASNLWEAPQKRVARFSFSIRHGGRTLDIPEGQMYLADECGRPLVGVPPAGFDQNALAIADVESLYVAAKFGYHAEIQAAFARLSPAVIQAAVSYRSSPGAGWTMLHQAAYLNHGKLCALLLQHGADRSVTTRDGETAQHLATSPHVRQILRSNFTTPSSPSSPSSPPSPSPPSPSPSPSPSHPSPSPVPTAPSSPFSSSVSSSSSSSSPVSSMETTERPAPSATASVTITECVVCFDKPRGVALPCGHFALCHSCSVSVSKCPLCQVPFTQAQVLKIFIP